MMQCGANIFQANNDRLDGKFKLNPTDGSCSDMISCMTDKHFTILALYLELESLCNHTEMRKENTGLTAMVEIRDGCNNSIFQKRRERS